MIHLSCNNCGWALFGRAVIRVDSGSVEMTCHRCGEIYRVSIVKLHSGKPQNNEETEKRLRVVAICNLCEPAVSFASLKEASKHKRDLHQVWKG